MGVGINGTQHLWLPSTYPLAASRSRLFAVARCLLWQVEHGKVIVHTLPVGRDRKVRRDDPGGTHKLSCATSYFPQHTTPLESFDPARELYPFPRVLNSTDPRLP